MSQSVPLPPSLPPRWGPRGSSVAQPAAAGVPSGDGGRRRSPPQCWDDRVAMTPRPDIPVLQATSLTAGDVCTVTVSGEIDCLTAPGLEEALRAVLDRPQPPGCVVVDLRRVTFLAAAGLRVLTGAHRRAENAGGALRIRCGDVRCVTRPLEVTGLWDALHIIERERAGDDG